MNWKSFMVGLGSGLAGGLVAHYLLSKETKYASPEKILEQVKADFKQQGPVSGSWIHMEAVPYEQNKLQYSVYKGGISKNRNNATEQYEFIADATTGTILAINRL